MTTPPRTTVAARLRRLAVDTGPLRRHRDFRLLWTGELVSQTGTQIGLVAVFIQVFELTDSPAAVGAIGLAQLGPLVVMTLLGGPLIDRFDRRRLSCLARSLRAGVPGPLALARWASSPRSLPLAAARSGRRSPGDLPSATFLGNCAGAASGPKGGGRVSRPPSERDQKGGRHARSSAPPSAACSSAGRACRGPTASTSSASRP